MSATILIGKVFAQWGHKTPPPEHSLGNHYDPKDVMKNYLNGNLVTLDKALKELEDDKYAIWCGYGLAYYERRM